MKTLYFDQICASRIEKSIGTWNYAEENNKLPSRSDFAISFLGNVVAEVFDLGGKVSIAAIKTFEIFLLPFYPSGKLSRAIYYLPRTLILDPLDLTLSVAICAMKITFAVVGIVSPTRAKKIWITAQKVELLTYSIKFKVWNWFAPSFTPCEPFPILLKLSGTEHMLSPVISKEYENKLGSSQNLEELDNKIKLDFEELATKLRENGSFEHKSLIHRYYKKYGKRTKNQDLTHKHDSPTPSHELPQAPTKNIPPSDYLFSTYVDKQINEYLESLVKNDKSVEDIKDIVQDLVAQRIIPTTPYNGNPSFLINAIVAYKSRNRISSKNYHSNLVGNLYNRFHESGRVVKFGF